MVVFNFNVTRIFEDVQTSVDLSSVRMSFKIKDLDLLSSVVRQILNVLEPVSQRNNYICAVYNRFVKCNILGIFQ